jgi:hypothetical protein
MKIISAKIGKKLMTLVDNENKFSCFESKSFEPRNHEGACVTLKLVIFVSGGQ